MKRLLSSLVGLLLVACVAVLCLDRAHIIDVDDYLNPPQTQEQTA